MTDRSTKRQVAIDQTDLLTLIDYAVGGGRFCEETLRALNEVLEKYDCDVVVEPPNADHGGKTILNCRACISVTHGAKPLANKGAAQ